MAEAILLLANSAEVGPNGLAYALGLGWNQTTSPTAPAALVICLSVAWDETNKVHNVEIELVDEDGGKVLLGQDEHGNASSLMIGFPLEVGRPPGTKAGQSFTQTHCVSVEGGLPLTPGGYEWRVRINGDEKAARPFRVG